MKISQDSDIELKEILGPEGWDGCLKAAEHKFTKSTARLIESGPEKGKTHEWKQCDNCGFYSSRISE